MKPSLPSSSPSFALISVLALVSLAALTATAFLASARLERQATRSIGSQTQLDMALSSGMECAAQTINIFCEPKWNTAAVYWRGTNAGDWTNEIGYLLLGRPNSISNLRWTYFSAFSPAVFKNIDTNAFLLEGTNIRQDSYLADIGAFMTNMTNGFVANPSATNTNCTQIPLLGGRTSPPVGWVYIFQPKPIAGTTNTTNTPVARFAYFMEDLQGYIDAERMGGLTSRDTGTNPQEICLTNMLGANSANFCNSNNRIKYLSPGMMMYAGGISSSNLNYVATHLLSWTNSPQFVPFGIPVSSTATYANAGTNKTNLNTLLSGVTPNNAVQKVADLAQFISNNIPSFASTKRSGAMSGGAYLSNIAANIVDYVDTDTNPTIDSSAGIPNWRGVDAIAWPNEIYMRFNLTERQTNLSASPPNYLFKLGVKQYIEVWNLSSTSVVVNGSDYSISNNLDIPLKCTNWNGNLKSADSTTPPASESCTNASFTLPANSYGVLSAGTRTFNILVPTNLAPGTTTPMLTVNPSTTVNKYTISYSNKIIDATPGGRWLGFSTNMQVGAFHFITTAVNFGTTANGSTYNLASGDPRGGLFIQKPMMDMPYTQTTPGGRNSHLSSSGGARIVDPQVNWVDGGHSSTLDIATSPTSPSANNSIPQGLQKSGNPNHWIQKINNSGNLTNIMELGNIFDPIQWGNPINPFHPLDTAAWMELNATATNFDGACGRNSLRIGRAEHQRFAFTNYSSSSSAIPNMGLSAAALLDIFCITNNFDTGGRVNLNTAPAPVLRALALGINLKSDLALKAGSGVNNNYPVPNSMAEAFAQGVMRFRAKYPFLTPSHLAFIGTDPSWPNTTTWPSNSVFGNTNIITLTNIPGSLASSANIGVSEWNDQAAEEWFSKIYQLSTVQSFNYRVYVVAQLVGTNLMPKGAMARKYYHLYLRNNSPTNISAGPFMNYQSAY
jgi:hypothetical protein